MLDLILAILGLGFASLLAHGASGDISAALLTTWALGHLNRFLAEHRVRRYVKR